MSLHVHVHGLASRDCLASNSNPGFDFPELVLQSVKQKQDKAWMAL